MEVFFGFLRKFESYLYLIFVFFGFIWINSDLLDDTFINRFAIFEFIQILLLVKLTFKNNLKINLNISLLIIVIIFFLQSAGLFFSYSKLAVLYEMQKTIFLFTTIIIIQQISEKYLLKIIQLIILIFLFYFCYSLLQFVTITNITKQELYQITSLNGHKNLYSSFVVLLTISINLISLKINNYKKLTKVISFIALFLIFIIQTRSAIFGVIIGFLVLSVIVSKNLIVQYKYGRYLFLAFFLVLFYGFLFLFPFAQNIIESESAQERIKIWNITLQIIKDNFFIGIGAGNWGFIFPSYGLPEIQRLLTDNVIFVDPHNEFLKQFSELGFFGFTSFVLLFSSIYIVIVKLINVNMNFFTSTILIGFTAYVIIMVFDFPNTRIEHLIILGIIIALIFENNLLSIKLNSLIVLLIILSSLSFFVLIKRYDGESNAKKMLEFRTKKECGYVVKFSEKSANNWFKFDPNLIPISWYLGESYYNLGDKQSARKEYENAYSINQYNCNVINNYAVLISEDNHEKSINLFEKSLYINPKFDQSRINLIKILLRDKNFDLSLKHINMIRDDEKRSQMLFIYNKLKK